ncbi:uncharacterized protein LOC133695633 isoform X3 [Populus nigra]|uniref:uncharacterized protein LOC133695633 isoform X3 n=1 Tax=Populus nigra TaxID=3691 RepID=UPI002B27360D|nr:uncharacterized protein LOC133695633 isoform X3 [Populus nigra]
MEIEEEEVKWEAMEPERDEPVLKLGLRRRRAPEQSLHSLLPSSISLLAESLSYINLVSLKFFQKPAVDLSPMKHMSGASQKIKLKRAKRLPPLMRAFASPRHWMQLSDIDLSNLEILPEIVGSFFYQAHDKILDSITAFFPDLFHLQTLTLSDNDVLRLQPVLASRNKQPIPEFLMEKLPELASGNNQTIPEFLTEKLPELRSWNDHSLQELIANTILMEKLCGTRSGLLQSYKQMHAVYVEAEQLLDAGESSRPREISGWTLLMTNLILEIASAVFDQMGYAQIGMVLAFVALLLAAVDLIHMARKERIKRAAGMSLLPLFHPRSTYTSATRKPVGTIVEYFGLAGAVWQCVYSTVEYTYTRQKKDNPIKISLLPFIFLLCVVISKLLVDESSIDKSS